MARFFRRVLAIVVAVFSMTIIVSCTGAGNTNDELGEQESVAGQSSMTSNATVVSVGENKKEMICDLELDRDNDGTAEDSIRVAVSYEFAYPTIDPDEFEPGDHVVVRYQWIYLPDPPDRIGALSIEKVASQ